MTGQALLWGALYALPIFVRGDFLLTIFIFTFIYAILAVTFDLIFGFTGQLSMFHPAVFGVSAYMTDLLASSYKLPFWVATLPSAAASVVLAIIVGSICFKFRLKTFYFAVVTLAFSEMIRLVVMTGTVSPTAPSASWWRASPRSTGRAAASCRSAVCRAITTIMTSIATA